MITSNATLCDDIIVLDEPNDQACALHAMERWYNHCFKSERLTACGRTREAKVVIQKMRLQLKGGTVKP